MKRILVIDDEEGIRKLLRKVFERAGYEVADAPNGKRGEALLGRQSFDLVVLDILMPEQGGIQTINNMKKDFSHIPIIAMSGGGRTKMLDFLKAAKMFGAVQTFQKPIEHEQLLEAVHTTLG